MKQDSSNLDLPRRRFLANLARVGISASLAPMLWNYVSGSTASAAPANGGFHPADFWHAEGADCCCDLCPREETLHPGDVGKCHVRQNRAGKLFTTGYDQPAILNVDPIEKNPLAHVSPGAEVLSIAHSGCNIQCLYCQNWQFSQRGPNETRNIADFDRKTLVPKITKRKLRGLAFTYTEPSVTPEFVADLASAAAAENLLLTICSCGFLNREPLQKLLKAFHAVTITFKGPTEEFYEKVCNARLKPVQDSMLAIKAMKKWLEVATLVVPTLNDDNAALRTMAAWICRNLGPDTPWHLERFTPQYKLTNLPLTPQATMEKARKIGQDAGLRFVYISNLAPHEGNHTYCPGCKRVVIMRLGFKVLKNELKEGRCPHCRASLPGLWA